MCRYISSNTVSCYPFFRSTEGEHAQREATLTRDSARDSLAPATVRVLPGQLSHFPGSSASSSSVTTTSPRTAAASPQPAPATPPESRRGLRPSLAPREARLPATDEAGVQERSVTIALKPYLPPGKGLGLVLTDNHYSMISLRRRPDGYLLRLHKMFVGAPPRIFRVHPILDHDDAPALFIRWIVFHEMLHGRHDIVRKGRRRIFHSPAFIADEQSYPDFARATAWEKANLDRLLGG